MTARWSIAIAAAAALLVSACSPGPQSLIVGKWEADAAVKVTAEFHRDGTANLTMMGQTIRGTYRFSGDNELEWTVNGASTKMKIHVTPAELELTDGFNQTIKYKRK